MSPARYCSGAADPVTERAEAGVPWLQGHCFDINAINVDEY
ncbi:hypothetical protein [Arthrobacter sp. S2(2024)]